MELSFSADRMEVFVRYGTSSIEAAEGDWRSRRLGVLALIEGVFVRADGFAQVGEVLRVHDKIMTSVLAMAAFDLVVRSLDGNCQRF